MARKLKVYGWHGYRHGGQTRNICAANSFAELVRKVKASGVDVVNNMPRRDYTSETGNAAELEVALASPGVVFWRPVDSRARAASHYKRAGTET